MNLLRNSALSLLLVFAALAVPGTALAFDAGVRTPVLADHTPAAVSVPFEIPVVQSAAVPQPLHFEIAVGGFDLDPDPVAGKRIGSFDMVSDSGDFDDTAILSGGPGTSGLRTWTLVWGLADPITATVEDGFSLTTDGERTPDPDSTLISFTVPGNYHGFRLMGMSLRFNQEDGGRATEGTGAVNPPAEGRYLIRSRIESVAPQSQVNVASAWARIGPPAPKTALSVKASRYRVKTNENVRFRIRTTNRTSDQVEIRIGDRLLREVSVGPEAKTIRWRAGAKISGRQVRFRFKPANGPPRTIRLRIARR